MYSLLITICIILAILMIIVVLLQSGKGEGLAGTFGGGQNLGAAFGARRTADFLSKLTWWLGGLLLALSLITNLYFLPGQTTADQRESIIQNSQRNQAPAAPSNLQNIPSAEEEPAAATDQGEN